MRATIRLSRPARALLDRAREVYPAAVAPTPAEQGSVAPLLYLGLVRYQSVPGADGPMIACTPLGVTAEVR